MSPAIPFVGGPLDGTHFSGPVFCRYVECISDQGGLVRYEFSEDRKQFIHDADYVPHMERT